MVTPKHAAVANGYYRFYDTYCDEDICCVLSLDVLCYRRCWGCNLPDLQDPPSAFDTSHGMLGFTLQFKCV